MLQSIKTSEANRTVVAEMTNKLGLGPENVIARLAFAYSMSRGKKLDLGDIQDSKGKEYSAKVLFGDYLAIYGAIVCQHYGLHRTDPDIPKYVKMHIDDGLTLIAQAIRENPGLRPFDFILEQVEQGLEAL